jgi:DNA-binding NarL/FixJ family response regulator
MENFLDIVISIGIVDDSSIYRDALVSFFKTVPTIKILFEAENGIDLEKKLKLDHPQVILLDLNMPKMDGMKTLKRLRDKFPSIKFIILTMNEEENMINSFLSLGANSYLNKSASPDEIYNAIVNCYNNDFYLNSIMSNAIKHRMKKK